MRTRVITLALVATLLLGGCRPTSLYFVQPSGPPEYKLGWEDGCNTGISASGGMVYKAVFGFQKRPEFGDNEVYKSAWNEGFTYCRFSLEAVDKSSPYN